MAAMDGLGCLAYMHCNGWLLIECCIYIGRQINTCYTVLTKQLYADTFGSQFKDKLKLWGTTIRPGSLVRLKLVPMPSLGDPGLPHLLRHGSATCKTAEETCGPDFR